MPLDLRIGACDVSDESPVVVVAEIGINHNGSVDIAKQLIDAACAAQCDFVKFQKRTPERCVPRSQWHVEKDTPWGKMSYIRYRERVEFGTAEYEQIDEYCAKKGIGWFASAWDVESVDFLEGFAPPCYKIPSAMLTKRDVINACIDTGRAIVISTGMSTQWEIDEAVSWLGRHPSVLMHCTSTYPCKPEELNLNCIPVLREKYPHLFIGYSGHETGIPPTLAAVALGARMVERHITLDRTMWGTDQSASLEPVAVAQLVRQIRTIERSMGDGQKRVYQSEMPSKYKLRGSD